MKNWTADGLYIIEGHERIGKFQKEASFSNPESARNAQLAAAAPQLLEALTDLVNHLPFDEIELARNAWGHTNTRLIIRKVVEAKRVIEVARVHK